MNEKAEIVDRSSMLTEQRLAASMELDRMPMADALRVMQEQDMAAVAAVGSQHEEIARAIDMVAGALSRGGRLIYIGAGTSGRLGVLDASECPPTFGVEPNRIVGIIAGGNDAMFRSKEGAEDQREDGAAAMDQRDVSGADVVLGIAAGGTTPFVRGALLRARERGAKTIFLCCVEKTDAEPGVDLVIRPLTGPEVLTGSTRLKAGTATKLILNRITTLAMVRLGKVYENLMVDLRASNAKLRDRAVRIVMMLTGVSRESAAEILGLAGGEVKTAIVMSKREVGAEDARELLMKNGGSLRRALSGGR